MGVFSLETVWLGLNSLRLHKLRSLLTALGIIFGVAAVICMLSISEGASADELRLIHQLGTRNIIVTSVKPADSGQAAEANTRVLYFGVTYRDLNLIRETIPHLEAIVPVKTVAHMVRRHDKRMEATVNGVTVDFFKTVSAEAARGRLFTHADEADRKNVCVIGEQIRDRLFAYEDPIGQTILASRDESATPYTVIGVLKPVQTVGAPQRGVVERNLNSEIYIPYESAAAQYGEVFLRRTSGQFERFNQDLSGLYLAVDELENVIPVSEAVARIFQFNHSKVDYDIRVPLRSLQLAERKKRNSQYLLGFIAGISLLVGGIGIMNIMLATVTERTREIGIRRALGAKRQHITAQFLVETVVMSTAGGLIGIALGYFGAYLITFLADWGDAIVRLWSVLISFGLSVLVGIIFGLWPAMTAARLDPIEALRYE